MWCSQIKCDEFARPLSAYEVSETEIFVVDKRGNRREDVTTEAVKETKKMPKKSKKAVVAFQ